MLIYYFFTTGTKMWENMIAKVQCQSHFERQVIASKGRPNQAEVNRIYVCTGSIAKVTTVGYGGGSKN